MLTRRVYLFSPSFHGPPGICPFCPFCPKSGRSVSDACPDGFPECSREESCPNADVFRGPPGNRFSRFDDVRKDTGYDSGCLTHRFRQRPHGTRHGKSPLFPFPDFGERGFPLHFRRASPALPFFFLLRFLFPAFGLSSYFHLSFFIFFHLPFIPLHFLFIRRFSLPVQARPRERADLSAGGRDGWHGPVLLPAKSPFRLLTDRCRFRYRTSWFKMPAGNRFSFLPERDACLSAF